MQEFAMVYELPPGDERTARGALDDERTVPGRPDDVVSAAPALGVAAANSSFAHHPLPYGTVIEGFRITGLIGEGGFGVVYRAWDDALERHVAIKEYMPETLAVRGKASLDVSVRSERHRNTFEAGLKSFVNEARLLARFDHPALVKVLRFWEANHTAYMAMPYYEGPTIKTALDFSGSPPTEEALRGWLRPLLDALAVLHHQNYYHRDIAPDNILLTASGPLLLDFGAARHVIGDMTQTITVVLKPGYAPIEQYGGDTFQGPWTDLYALAGVVRYAITGKTPTPSVERVVNDTMQPLATTHAGRYSEGFLHAIDTALAVRPEARPQDVAQFRELLDAGLAPDSPPPFRSSGFQHSDFRTSDFSPSGFDRLPATDTPVATSAPPHPVSRRQAVPALRRLGKLAYALATAALLAVGGAVWWVKVREARAPVVAPMPNPAPAPALTAPEPVLAPAPAPAPVAEPKQAPALEQTPSAPPAAAPDPLASPIRVPAPSARPAPLTAVERPKPAAPATRPATESRRPPQEQAESSATPKVGGRPAGCSDILQKASLEPLDPQEAAYLKRECR